MLVMARAAQRAERAWLEEALRELLTADPTDDQRP
jgi:hypothetical protein